MSANNSAKAVETVEIGGVAHGGFCVGRLASGKVAMIRGALPGERVRVEITSERSKVAYGRVVEVTEASADRVPEIWPEGAARDIGGVELGHVSYPAQLRWKREVLAEALRRNGSAELEAMVSAVIPDWEVESLGDKPGRTRVSFIIDDQGRPAMSEAGSHQVHAIKSFPLTVPGIDELRLFERPLGFAPGTRVKAVAPSASAPVLAVGGEVYNADLIPTTPRVREVVEDAKFRIFASSFWQTDYRAPATLSAALLAGIGEVHGFETLELYSGSGLFSVFLGRALGKEGRLTTVEGSGPAVKSAAYNLEHAGFGGVKTLRGNVDARLLNSLEFGERVSAGTLVVADPPRTGLGEKTAKAICEKEPFRIALLSCDPVSAARDLEAIRKEGYVLKTFRAFDLFPYTFHMEALAVLEKN